MLGAGGAGGTPLVLEMALEAQTRRARRHRVGEEIGEVEDSAIMNADRANQRLGSSKERRM